MNNYEQRVCELAERMATASVASMYINGDAETGKQLATEAARIGVKEQENVARNVWWRCAEDGLRSLAEQQLFEIYLQEQGLIPPPEAEKEVNNEQ